MANSLTITRRNKLAQILVSEGSVKVGKLAELFGVSTETIRKDLLYLESEGIARKSHGGAIAASEFLELERPFVTKSLENIEVKTKIAQAAINLIPENGVVILDAGSTVFSIAKLLSLKKGITVITNSIVITQILSSTDTIVYSIGGRVRGRSMAFVGLWGIEALNSVNVDIAFIGTVGFSHCSGPCTASYDDAQIKKAMIRSAKIKVVVGDSRKFRSTGLFQFCDWKEIDYFITDSEAPKDEVERMGKITKIIIV